MRSIAGTNILVDLETPGTGYAVTGIVTSSGALPTTASTFAVGCRIYNTETGVTWVNMGTVAVPVWTSDVITKKVSLTAAQLIAMYANPVELIPAVPGYNIILDSFEFDITRTSTAFTDGGVVAPQYNSTANGGGTAMTATIAATVLTGAAGRTLTARIPVVLSDVATASITGIGVYISNQTAAFAAGTGTAEVTLKYHLV